MTVPPESTAAATPPAGASPTEALWRRFDPESTQRDRLAIFCGVPLQLTNEVMHFGMARSEPATGLLRTSPHLLRHLAHQTTVRTERCVGHVRGPIMWSETITAWNSGMGVDDVFICGSPQRDFDVPENRLLVWLLRRIVAASRRSTGEAARLFPDDDVERVTHLGRSAQQLLSHRVLRGVPGRRPDGREWRLIRKSRHLDTYEPALRLARAVTAPFVADDIVAMSSASTREHHRVVALLLDALEERGHAVPRLSVRGDYMESGPLRYRNPFVMVDRRLTGTSGMHFGDVRVVTRADETPAERAAVVVTADDARAVVAHVLGPRTSAVVHRDTALAPDRHSANEEMRRGEGQSSASGLVQLPGS